MSKTKIGILCTLICILNLFCGKTVLLNSYQVGKAILTEDIIITDGSYALRSKDIFHIGNTYFVKKNTLISLDAVMISGPDTIVQHNKKKYLSPYHLFIKNNTDLTLVNDKKKTRLSFVIDSTPPQLNVMYRTNTLRGDGTPNIINNNSVLSILATDALTGVGTIEYKLKTTGTWKKYTGSIIPAGDKGELLVRAQDLFGNDTISRYVYIVDNDAPIISINQASNSAPIYFRGDTALFYDRKSKLSFRAMDNYSTDNFIYISVGSMTDWQLYTEFLQPSHGESIFYYAIDSVGNCTEVKTLHCYLQDIHNTIKIH